jgi:hypothetical protein
MRPQRITSCVMSRGFPSIFYFTISARGGRCAVVANPSSYAYFNEDRPYPTADCPTFDNGKYGMKKRPPYAANTAPASPHRAS